MVPTPAKISRPIARGAIERKALERRITAADAPVIWIAAPPGSGKTTLLARALGEAPGVVWYRFDETDGDPGTFFYYLAEAARRLEGGDGGPGGLPLFQTELLAGLEIFARRFFGELFARMEVPSILVFDDYHEIDPGAPIHDLLARALGRLPEGIRVVVASREDPPRAFARLRVHGTLELLGWEELRFTEADVRHIVRSRRGRGGGDGDPAALLERTEGWAAGIALLLGEGAVTTGPLRVDSDPGVLSDYFSTEVLDRIDPRIRGLVVRTSLPDHLTGEEATLLTGDPRAAEVLAELASHHRFVERQHAHESLFRYHPLFRSFLRTRLVEDVEAGELGELRVRCARLLERRGEIEGAIELLREAGEPGALAERVLTACPVLYTQGRSRTLDGWISELPSRIREEHPWLLYWRGLCRLLSAPPSPGGTSSRRSTLSGPGGTPTASSSRSPRSPTPFSWSGSASIGSTRSSTSWSVWSRPTPRSRRVSSTPTWPPGSSTV